MKKSPQIPLLSLGALFASSAFAQSTGPSTASTPYLLPTAAGYETISVLTVDNTGATPDDVVAKIGGGSYGMDGIPDGLGAYDNGDGTFTVLMSHELGNTSGVTRAHGAIGAYVSRFVINKNTLAVISGEDLMKQTFGWNAALQQSNTTPTALAFNRFCSGDLPAVSAYFNSNSGLGSTARIYMHGEEGSSTGWQIASVATGPDAGKSYVLGKFSLTTNGSGLTGVGAWENALANPFAQDKTIVIGTSDGGTGIMNNALAVYVGTKQSTGSEVDKAGLTNGTLKFVNVTGNPLEIPTANTNSRVTEITSGTPFTLSGTASTFFSRPEDGAWNPSNPSQFYFLTTDRLDQVSDGLGAQIGITRLWRLNFTDITNPDLGGTIDLLINGATIDGEKVNMFDNMCVNAQTGHLILQEDVGGAPHNGKIWDYNPATGVLKKVLKHDPARFGDRANGITTAATSPFTNDEEGSGIIDITPFITGSALLKGNPREAWYLTSDQAHYTTGITTSQSEGGQLVGIHEIAPADNVTVTRTAVARDRRTGQYVQQVTITNNNAGALVGPFYLAVDSLSANATVVAPAGTTGVYAPLGSPYVLITGGNLAPGASATITLAFTNPSNAGITYVARVLNSVSTP
ncbi:MAG: hypothetical protein QM760_00530 [Nibricoccus sp.]